MAVSSCDLSDMSVNVSDSDSEETIEALSCALRLSRRELDKDLTNAIKDCSERTDVWTIEYYNERAKDLEKRKDNFLI